MKKIICGMLILPIVSLAMQQPARVYDHEQTNILKSLLNSYDGTTKVPYSKIEELVVMGADPNVKADCGVYEGSNWFERITANELQSAACLSVMLLHGANPADRLFAAIIYGHHALAVLLLDYGANVHGASGPRTPLFGAVMYGNMGIAKLLLERGAASDIDKLCDASYTPLSWAKFKGTSVMVKLLETYRNKP